VTQSVGKAAALEAVRHAALDAGYPWVGPNRVTRGLRYYHVHANRLLRGGNVHAKVARRTGEVVSLSITPK
jgi:hypothetical protein